MVVVGYHYKIYYEGKSLLRSVLDRRKGMKKVLIVDDEFLVRLGLKTTINWETHGYIIIGEAANGKEALDIFKKTDPDILITDIKMPVMDGLELIKSIKKIKKDIQVIILSNYAEFSFARQAVELGVFQYMLKSEINSENLIDVLKSLTIEWESEVRGEVTGYNKREEYLKTQLFGLPMSSKALYNSILAPKDGLFNQEKYAILILYCDITSLTESATDMLNKALCALMDTTFHEPTYCTKVYKGQIFFTLITDILSEEQEAYKKLLEQCNILARNAKHYFDTMLQGGISTLNTPEQFSHMLWEAEMARENCFFSKENFCVYNKAEMIIQERPIHISHKKMNRFLEDENKEGALEYIKDIFVELKDTRNYQNVKNTFIDLLAIAKSICEGLGENRPQSLDPVKFDYDNLMHLQTLESVEKYIGDIYQGVFALNGGNSDIGYSSTVKSCIVFIESNFASNISLDDAARAVNVSKSYLSMLFKQETGTNFVTYLNEYRIKKAKNLLIKTNLKIYEVAEKVGFFSPYYFSKIFKETTGLNCREYKDKYFEK